MRISILQTDIAWENKQENLRRLRERLETLCGETDIVVLPETFSTGFSMNPAPLAEPVSGETITTLRQWASDFGMAIAGSYLACEEEEYHNRAFFLTPEGEAHFYDKHHLFRMGGEAEHFTPGTRRPILSYRGWNILLLICYDLRFPVWSRNVDNEYDLLIYVANWPTARRTAWDVLLRARALENLCYVCGVNRVGMDGHDIPYNGGSVVCSYRDGVLASLPNGEEAIATADLDLAALQAFREKFPAWRDADNFVISSGNSSR